MELLFAWICNSEYGIISEQGFNFSPQYNFCFEKKEEGYFLSEDECFKNNINVFHISNIVNVSAVVGKNGAGKTELLCTLRNPFRPDITVIKREDGLYVYLNPTYKYKVTVSEPLRSKIRMIIDLSQEDIFEKVCVGSDISSIYLTNSFFTRKMTNGYHHDESMCIELSPDRIDLIGQGFYKSVFLEDNDGDIANLKGWLSHFSRRGRTKHIQSIADIVLYNWVLKHEYNNYLSMLPKHLFLDIPVSFDSIRLQRHSSYSTSPENQDFLIEMFDAFKETDLWRHIKYSDNPYSRERFENHLIFLYAVEEFLALPNSESSEYINKSKNIDVFIAQVIEEDKDDIIMHIKNVVACINRSGCAQGMYIRNEQYLTLVSTLTKELLGMLMFFLEHKMFFFFRYINITFSELSSGEQTYNNMFAWPLFTSFYHKYYENKGQLLRKNLLFMIDECDLYLHPDWQKALLSELLKGIEVIFANHNVQLILATHSPLCLSDIPKENIIFLAGKDERGHCIVDSRENHPQTFGMELFSILQDAFFLKSGTMGTFAHDYINRVISKVNSISSDTAEQDIELIQKEINLIGNLILKQKIQQLFYKKTMSKKEMRINALLEERNRINAQLEELMVDYD